MKFIELEHEGIKHGFLYPSDVQINSEIAKARKDPEHIARSMLETSYELAALKLAISSLIAKGRLKILPAQPTQTKGV